MNIPSNDPLWRLADDERVSLAIHPAERGGTEFVIRRNVAIPTITTAYLDAAETRGLLSALLQHAIDNRLAGLEPAAGEQPTPKDRSTRMDLTERPAFELKAGALHMELWPADPRDGLADFQLAIGNKRVGWRVTAEEGRELAGLFFPAWPHGTETLAAWHTLGAGAVVTNAAAWALVAHDLAMRIANSQATPSLGDPDYDAKVAARALRIMAGSVQTGVGAGLIDKATGVVMRAVLDRGSEAPLMVDLQRPRQEG